MGALKSTSSIDVDEAIDQARTERAKEVAIGLKVSISVSKRMDKFKLIVKHATFDERMSIRS